MSTRRVGRRPDKSGRARHLPKRSWPLLDVDAASGRYRIDALAVELYADSAFLNNESFESFLKRLRRSVESAGYYSLRIAQVDLVRIPEQIEMTKRFFKDVKVINHLIERNRKMNPNAVAVLVEHMRRKSALCGDRTSSLLTKLRDVQAEIVEYLSDYRLRDGRGGNRDPLSYYFISEMLDFRRDYVAPEQSSELAYIESGPDIPKMFRGNYRLFARLLAAAWRDLRYPLVDHRNQSREPLEDWFADRVRKHVYTSLPADDLPADEF